MDLVTGCFEGGLYLMKGLGDGEYAEPEPMLDKEGAWIRLGQYWCQENDEWTNVETSTFASEHGISGVPIDWDDDGDQDLLIGASSGHVFLRVNEGTAKEYAYATQSVQVEAAGELMKAPGGGAMVITADWDLDGAWDILIGCANGAVAWYRNVGKPSAPLFEDAVLLIEEAERGAIVGEPTRPGERLQIDVGDYNGDGLPDLLVGDNASVKPAGPSLSEEDAKLLEEMRTELRSSNDEYYAVLTKAQEEGIEYEDLLESNEEFADLADTRANLRAQIALLDPPAERHGWVWVYLRQVASP
jgi:uncharacterized membrane protein